jgi:hypothetical protein
LITKNHLVSRDIYRKKFLKNFLSHILLDIYISKAVYESKLIVELLSDSSPF